MKNFWSKISIMLMVLILTSPLITTAETDTDATAVSNKGDISIVFSHDMHSHLEKFPKISTFIDEKKADNKATFVVDAGDFSMGTPYQTIYKSEASELRMMGFVGYDAVTLGNHEFDYRSKGLTDMLKKAASTKEVLVDPKKEKKEEVLYYYEEEKEESLPETGPLPQLVISNIDWDGTLSQSEFTDDAKKLQMALDEYGASQDYTVLERGGAKIAVFGIFGEESASYAPESGTLFKNPVETAKKIVADIKANEEVDLIVCLSHSGTNADDPNKSEDEIIAREVSGIDLIISGHSHTELAEPLVENGTIIASAGQYNDNLGTVTFTEKDGKYEMISYELIPLEKNIRDDEETALLTEQFKLLADERYFSKFGYKWDQILSRNDIQFTGIDTFGSVQREDTLGNLIADSYIYGVKQTEGGDYENVDIAVAPAGVIRGSFSKGAVTVADAFNALSLGTGKDGIAGYPLVSIYLTGKELKLAAEIDISISEIMQPARLYFSGLSYTYNPNRLILSRAYDIELDVNGEKQNIEDDKLYRVVADLYSAQMLGTVNSMSYGLLSVVPKDEDGNEVTDYESRIIYNKDGSELKEWYALASYIESFGSNGFPDKYSQLEGRKILEDSGNIIDILKQPNRFFWLICGIVLLVIAIITLIVVLIVRTVRRRRKGKSRLKKKDMIFSR